MSSKFERFLTWFRFGLRAADKVCDLAVAFAATKDETAQIRQRDAAELEMPRNTSHRGVE